MSANPHWPRWILASIAKHIDARRNNIPLFIEGQHRNTRDEPDLFELRVDGPYFTEVSKGYWHVVIDVSVLIQSAIRDTEFYRIQELAGLVAAAFTKIHVFKYGNESSDDDSQLGCMKLIADIGGKQGIEISHYGQLAPAEKILQATVEGTYEMRLTT